MVSSNDVRNDAIDSRLVQERRCCRVEVYVAQGRADLGHQGVEGQAAAPVGADDGVIWEVFDESPHLVWRRSSLAWVLVSHRLGAVEQQRQVQRIG